MAVAALISVIVPVYNTAPYLEACVRSVLEQTWTELELILADDGSEDGSGALCQRLSEEDGRIRVLRLEHRGVSAARNAAMRAARGEYLFFLDSDDGIHPELLQRLCQLAEETGAAMAASDFVRIEDGDAIPKPHGAEEHRAVRLDSREALDLLFSAKKNGAIFGMCGSKLLRRSAVGALEFDGSMSNGEDTKLMYQILKRGVSIVVWDAKWYYYRCRRQSVSQRHSAASYCDRYRCRRYIAMSELAAGNLANGAEMERRAVDSLVKGYGCSRREEGAEAVSAWNKLLREERRRPEFSLLPWHSGVRLKYELALRCYPLYRLLRRGWLMVKGKRRG